MTPIDFKTILQERVNWQGTQTGRFRMTDKEKLMTALTIARHAYDEAVAEERAAAREYTADLKAVAEAGEERRGATSQARHDAYDAHLSALRNLDAWRGE